MTLALLAPLLSSLLALTVPPFHDAPDWPQWRGAHGDGLSCGTPWSSTGKELWRAEIGLGYSAPSVADGRVLTYGHDAARALDVLRCLDAASGRELWRAEAPGELRANQHEGGTLSSPAVADGRVLVFSTTGRLAAHALADGAPLWAVDVAARHGVDPGYYGFAGSLVVRGEHLLLAADKTLALDPATGAVRWETPALEALYSTPAAFTLRGAERLGVFGQQGLHLLDPESGAELARFPWHDSERLVNAATPVVVGERLFVSSAYEHGCALVEFAADGPRASFRNKAMRNKMAGGVYLAGHLFGFDESVLKCLDLAGNERWRVRGLGSGALAGGDGKLAVLSSGGELIVAQATAESFAELTRVSLFEEGVCWTPPVIAGGRIYCRNNRGTLVARGLPGIGGPEVVARHPSLRLTGTYEQRSVGFVPTPFEIHAAAPGRRRVAIQFPPPLDQMFAIDGVPGQLVRVHDGKESFELNRYRGDKLLLGGEGREEGVAARFGSGGDLAALHATLTTEARVRFDERDCFRVAATTSDGKRRTLYFEVESGLLAGREPGGTGDDEALVHYRDWRAFDGLSLPTSQRVFRPDGGIEEHFRIESVAFEPVAEALFERSARVSELLAERAAAAR